MPLVPYSGDPDRFWPSSTLLDDSVLRTATNLNMASQVAEDNNAFLYRRLQAMRACNWSKQALIPGTVNQTCFGVDPVRRQYLACAIQTLGGGLALFGNKGADGEAQWNQIGPDFASATAWFSDVWVDRVATDWLLVSRSDSPTSLVIAKMSFTTLLWVGTGLTLGAGYAKATFDQIGSRVVASISGSDAAHSGIMSSDDQFASHVSIGFPTTYAYLDWLTASSGSLLLTTGAHFSALTSPVTYFTTANGVLFTPRHFPVGVVGASDRVTGLVWATDPVTQAGRFVLAVQKNPLGSPSPTVFYGTPDGVNWSTISTLPTGLGSFFLSDLAARDFLLIGTTADSVDGGPSTQVFSIDGGVTWYRSPVGFVDNVVAATRGYTPSRVKSLRSGFIAGNGTQNRMSVVGDLPEGAL